MMGDYHTTGIAQESVEQAEQAFQVARRRAWRNWLRGLLLRWPREMLSLGEVRRRITLRGQRDLGVRSVPLTSIIGSEGRAGDFDRHFLPLETVVPARWKRISQLGYEERPLPAVDLYKLGEIYFVRDGNHRVSVARARGQTDIDAHVVEILTDVPLTADLDAAGLARKEAQSEFLMWSRLLCLRPEAVVPVEASESETYRELMEHIDGHRYFLELDHGRRVPREEAIVSWYDRLYLPQLEAIDRGGVRQRFPALTRTGLYLRVMEHRYYMSQRLGRDPGPEAALADFARTAHTRRTLPGHITYLGQRLARGLQAPLSALLRRPARAGEGRVTASMVGHRPPKEG